MIEDESAIALGYGVVIGAITYVVSVTLVLCFLLFG